MPPGLVPRGYYFVDAAGAPLAPRIIFKIGRPVGRGLQIRCAPGARATCSAVLFGVLDHCRRPVRSAEVRGEELLAEGTRCGNLLVMR
jgi:hypothetical protein